MEDLKQIQEFFSKPVKENSRRSPDFILTEPAEIKYTESFGSGIKAPGVLHHANEGVFLGAEGAYIIVLPGGTFYVDEDKEEAIRIYPLKDQSRELQLALDYTPFSPKYETWKSWVKKPKTLEGAYSGFRRGEPEDPDSEPFNPTGAVAEFKEDLRALFGKFKGDLKNPEFIKGVAQIMNNWKPLLRSQLDEAKKKKAKKKDNRPIGKPMRDTSGGKAYKVYVKDPKTKKVKTVRFGSGGLRAKINDSKARKAFAARHKCSQKKDRTKASYWSCRLPRYAKLLGLKSSFSGFW